MPGERRTLRSSKESASSTNGEKSRSDSQSSTSNKDKPVPTRTTSAKGKTQALKKNGSSSFTKDGTGDKPQINGIEPVENGVNGTEDTEMADEVTDQAKSGQDKDGDDEMTVVVPPPKGSKLNSEPSKDIEGDIAMENSERIEADNLGSENENHLSKVTSGWSTSF